MTPPPGRPAKGAPGPRRRRSGRAHGTDPATAAWASEALGQALAHHRAGRAGEAEALYRQILKRVPRHAHTLNLLAILVYHAGRTGEARRLVKQALAAAPNMAEAHNTQGNFLLDQGRIEPAMASFRRALDRRPTFAEARVNLGNALARAGRPEAALPCYQRALDDDPACAEAHHNMGVALGELGQPDEAADCYRRAVAQRPGYAEAHLELGAILEARGALDEAAAHFAHAAARAPRMARAQCRLGRCLSLLGRRPEAEVALRRALSLDPKDVNAASGLGNLLAMAGRAHEALAEFERILAMDPVHETALHMRNALAGARSRTAPRGYVKALFDDYAGRFDQHLVERLDYRVPEKLRAAVLEVAQAAAIGAPAAAGRAGWRVLDVGCGTGLCGLEIRPHARHLVGVDLAPLMIAKARERGVYDELHEGEIGEVLAGRGAQFDVALAGDVFIYVGGLEALFAAVAPALAPGGVFAFSIERDDEADVTLRPTGRFAHAPAYLERLGRAHDMDMVLDRQIGVRKQDGAYIPGNVMVLRRRPAPAESP